MKKTLYIICPVILAILSVSCQKDPLSVKTTSSFAEDIIFSEPNLAEGAVFGIYEAMNDKAYVGRLWPFLGMNTDTEMHLGSASGMTEADNHRTAAVYKYTSTDNYYFDAVDGVYQAIERANICIEGIRKYGDPQPGTQMGHLLGEALFLRAYNYQFLVSHFGSIPFRAEPIHEDNMYIPRTERDVILKQCLDDLGEASGLLYWAGESAATADVLRANKGAAKALRARVALAAGGYSLHLYGELGVPSLSADPELSVEKTYTIARDECLDLIQNEGKGYNLESDFRKIFYDNCQLRAGAGSEPMWEMPFVFNHRGNNMVSGGVIHAGTNGSGNPAAGTDKWTTNYTGGTVGLVGSLFYDYEPADKRRDVSAVPFRWENGVQVLASIRRITPGKLRAEWTPAKIETNANDGVPPIILRYADVLLMFAEAENELNGGPNEAAAEALNRVRSRGYGADQSAYVSSVSGSKQDFFNAIVNERRLEFAGERIRKNDLIRWNMLKSKMDEAVNDLLSLRALSGKYSDVPAYVFWKYREGTNNTEIEYWGFDRGQFAPGTSGIDIVDQNALNAWMTAGGWQHYYIANTQGVKSNRLWIDPSDTGEMRDDYIHYFYLSGVNPDAKCVMPLPASIITAYQGAISNQEIGYP